MPGPKGTNAKARPQPLPRAPRPSPKQSKVKGVMVPIDDEGGLVDIQFAEYLNTASLRRVAAGIIRIADQLDAGN